MRLQSCTKEKSIPWPEDCSGEAFSLLARGFCPRYYRNDEKCQPELVSSGSYSKDKWAFRRNIRTYYLCTSLPRNKSVCLLLRVTTSPYFLIVGHCSASAAALCQAGTDGTGRCVVKPDSVFWSCVWETHLPACRDLHSRARTAACSAHALKSRGGLETLRLLVFLTALYIHPVWIVPLLLAS